MTRFEFDRQYNKKQWQYAQKHPVSYVKKGDFTPLGKTLRLTIPRKTDVRLLADFKLPYVHANKLPTSFPASREYDLIAQYDFCVN